MVDIYSLVDYFFEKVKMYSFKMIYFVFVFGK